MFAAMVLLVLPVFFPAVYGARIWITLPGIGSLQPAEFAKIIITVFFAGYLMVKRDALALASRRFMGLYLPRGRDLGPILVIWAMSLLILVFETDLGTSLLFFGLFVIMLYVATERTSWIVFGLLLSAGGAVAVSMLEPHVKERVQNWLHPLRLVDGGVTETAQTMYAFGSGGIFGSGLGQGYSRLIGGIAPKSDYILATVGEELALGEGPEGYRSEGDDARIDPGLREPGQDALQRGLLHHRDQDLGLPVSLRKDGMVPDHVLEIEGDRAFHLGGKHLLDASRIDEGKGENEARHLGGRHRHGDGIVAEGRKLREGGRDALGEGVPLGQRNATGVVDRETAEAALQSDHAQLVRRDVEAHDPVHHSSFQYRSLPSWSS